MCCCFVFGNRAVNGAVVAHVFFCFLRLVVVTIQSRARITGRVVPISLLEETMEQVPKSVAILKTKADFFVEVNNAGEEGDDVQIVQPSNLDWSAFARAWAPRCAAVPS